MRKALMNLAWGLATAALAIATPLRAVAEPTGVVRGAFAANASSAFTSADTLAATSTADAEVGGGWDEIICAGCVGVAAYTLFTGGAIMLPVLLTNTSTVGTLTGACLMACRSVYEEMME